MAMKLFKKLFARRKKENIVLTADEAYADSVPAAAPVPETESEASEARGFPNAEEEVSAEEAIVEETVAEEKTKEDADPNWSLWAYACLDDPRSAMASMRPQLIAHFKGLSEEPHKFSGTLSTGASVSVVVNTDIIRVHEQAGYLQMQYSNTFLTDRDVQNAAMMQIALFNIQIEFTLFPPYTQEDIQLLTQAAHAAVQPLRGFVVNSAMELTRWDGKLLISPDGRTDFNVFMPIRRSAVQGSSMETAAADEARKKRSNEALLKHGSQKECPLPVQVHENDVRLRTPEEIINRVACVFACVLKAQAYMSPRDISAPANWTSSVIKRMDDHYGVNRLFTGKELDYIVHSSGVQHERQLLRVESCAVLLWALHLYPMDWPTEPADFNTILGVIRDADTDVLLHIAKPRSLGEIMNMHDLTFRQHSLCVRDEEEAKNAHIDHDIAYERHYALNWLLAVDGISDWDMIIPKT